LTLSVCLKSKCRGSTLYTFNLHVCLMSLVRFCARFVTGDSPRILPRNSLDGCQVTSGRGFKKKISALSGNLVRFFRPVTKLPGEINLRYYKLGLSNYPEKQPTGCSTNWSPFVFLSILYSLCCRCVAHTVLCSHFHRC